MGTLDKGGSNALGEEDLTFDEDGNLKTNIRNLLAAEDTVTALIENNDRVRIDPAEAIDQPDDYTVGHDLIGTGDLIIGPLPVNKAEAVIISAKSTDANAFSVSVSWQDDAGNEFQTESNTDIGMGSITDDFAELVRKGKQIEITLTDESGAASNNVNVYTDTYR